MKSALHNNAKLYAKLEIDEELDDAELSVSAFRVYVHISHVCSKETVDMPPVTKIAAKVKMNRETVIKAIRELEVRGFIRVERSWGQQTDYHVNPKHCWIPVPKTDQYLKPASRKEAPVPKPDQPTSPQNRLVGTPPSSLGSSLSGSPSPAPSSSPPLTPPDSSFTYTPAPADFRLEAAPKKRNKTRTEDFEELKIHVIKNLGLPENDAAWLWEKWEGNGWKVDKKTMADWRMTASAWERAGYFPSQKQGQHR